MAASSFAPPLSSLSRPSLCLRRHRGQCGSGSQQAPLSLRARTRCAATGGRPRVLVNEKLGKAGVELLEKDCEVVEANYGPEDLLKEIPNFDGIVIRSGTKVVLAPLLPGKLRRSTVHV